MNLLVALVNKPYSTARISNYNIKRLYVYAAATPTIVQRNAYILK
jgi:hypothetical protein